MQLSENFVIIGNSASIETNFFVPVSLSDGFELGLASFICGGINNVDSHSNILFIEDRHAHVAEIEIPSSYYHTVGELLQGLKHSVNNYLKSVHKSCTLAYNVKNNLWKLSMPEHYKFIMCKGESRNVLNLLDLENGEFDILEAAENGFHPELMLAFMYCSVIAESYINGNQSRLLAVLPLSKNVKQNIYEPAVVRYYKIAIEEFNSIFIEFRDREGKLIEFFAPDSCTEQPPNKSHPLVLTLSLRKAI